MEIIARLFVLVNPRILVLRPVKRTLNLCQTELRGNMDTCGINLYVAIGSCMAFYQGADLIQSG